MQTAVIGFIISSFANCIYAARNFFDKKKQIVLSAIATAIWLFEYTFIFHSATYTLIMSFTLVYLIVYHYKLQLLHFFKIDVCFWLMILLIAIAIGISFITYEGADSIYGIIIMFLDLFSVYMFSAQGLRYKNGVVSLLYCILDFNLGNYFVVLLDLINLVVPVFTVIKHRKEAIVDREGLREYLELIKVSKEARIYGRSHRSHKKKRETEE